MSIIEDVLVPTAALGGAGAAIDFYLGSAGQKRVKAWLEEKWYRFHDVDWHNFTEREAQAYVDLADRFFGVSFFSRRRFLVSSVTVFLSTLVYFFQGPIDWGVVDEMYQTLIFTFVIDVCTLAAALSLTRAISLFAIRLTHTIGSIPSFLLLLMAHYVLIVVWRPILNTLLDLVRFSFEAGLSQAVFFIARHFTFADIKFDFSPAQIVEKYYSSISFRTDDTARWLFDLRSQRISLLSLLTNAVRVAFAFLLLLSFIVRAWVGPLISTTWARLVESDKPIFTMTFGAVGAIATSLKEIVKLF